MASPTFNSITLQLMDHQPVSLASLWHERPALLFFLRHPGCSICRQQLLKLRGYAPRFAALNVAIAAISMAEPQSAALLGKLHDLPFPLYSDERKAAYQLFGFSEGTTWDALGPAALWRIGHAAVAGQRISSNQGQSITQFGGLVLMDRQASTPRMLHIADPIYHYPPWEDVLGAAAELGKYEELEIKIQASVYP